MVVYTHATWRVRPGREAAFEAAWIRLGNAFAALDRPPGHGTLLRRRDDPSRFVSFGPWPDAEAVAAMRENAAAGEAMQAVLAECAEADPAAYDLATTSPPLPP